MLITSTPIVVCVIRKLQAWFYVGSGGGQKLPHAPPNLGLSPIFLYNRAWKAGAIGTIPFTFPCDDGVGIVSCVDQCCCCVILTMLCQDSNSRPYQGDTWGIGEPPGYQKVKAQFKLELTAERILPFQVFMMFVFLLSYA